MWNTNKPYKHTMYLAYKIGFEYPFEMVTIYKQSHSVYSVDHVFEDKIKAEIQQQKFIIEYIVKNQKKWKPGNKQGVTLFKAKKKLKRLIDTYPEKCI